MVLIRVAGNMVPSIRACIFWHFLEERVCIGPPELLVANDVGGQAPAGATETCCDPHVMWGERHLKSKVRPARLE
jgi:hypothetical protein